VYNIFKRNVFILIHPQGGVRDLKAKLIIKMSTEARQKLLKVRICPPDSQNSWNNVKYLTSNFAYPVYILTFTGDLCIELHLKNSDSSL